ncbi:ribose-phosphate pyrophosphokinase [Paracoccus aerodenitrificans]|uniref:ribose-phosphate pyrophosphokinase n=1 Tax=Paracoccus aerodenitrificans TaxID=3017781 RepID=UPI0022F12B8F|nr:ribose-phosphate pyrophosphokinase [Paracoccus aerodenitrificans]WBU63100.1 ribose-phosphate pyrophosphokinase [Paracoccus aerodenitrificans]
MPAMTEPKLISGNANKPLAQAIARRMSMHRGMNVALVDARVERFNDQEIFVEVFDNVRGEDMYIIQSTSNPANDNLLELLIMTDALKRSSANRITAVIPYFGYARQDRRAKARTPISAKLVANMLTTAGVDRVLTLDLHATQIQGFFDIPVDNLYAAPVFALDIRHHFKGRMDDLMVVSPDVGGVARAREIAQRIDVPMAIVDKRREKAGEVADMTVIGDVEGKSCIIVDDICDTAGTLVKAAQLLTDHGATEVHAYITHGVLSGPAVERVQNSVMKSLVITDSIDQPAPVKNCPNIRIVPTAPMFAQAIINIWNGTSVSSLFELDTLGPIYEGLYTGG